RQRTRSHEWEEKAHKFGLSKHTRREHITGRVEERGLGESQETVGSKIGPRE
ncbi:hypothetical protein M408DRAFT_333310, partial [Serendipita vermifera MAFF 305830]